MRNQSYLSSRMGFPTARPHSRRSVWAIDYIIELHTGPGPDKAIFHKAVRRPAAKSGAPKSRVYQGGGGGCRPQPPPFTFFSIFLLGCGLYLVQVLRRLVPSLLCLLLVPWATSSCGVAWQIRCLQTRQTDFQEVTNVIIA